jgi:hypothetical protein
MSFCLSMLLLIMWIHSRLAGWKAQLCAAKIAHTRDGRARFFELRKIRFVKDPVRGKYM